MKYIYKDLTIEEIEDYFNEIYKENMMRPRSRNIHGFYGEGFNRMMNLELKKDSYRFLMTGMTLEEYEEEGLKRFIDAGEFGIVDGLIEGIKERQKIIDNKKWVEEQSTLVIPSNKWKMFNEKCK